jgi:hypothetical protein
VASLRPAVGLAPVPEGVEWPERWGQGDGRPVTFAITDEVLRHPKRRELDIPAPRWPAEPQYPIFWIATSEFLCFVYRRPWGVHLYCLVDERALRHKRER